MQTSAILVQKTLDYSKFIVSPLGQEGLSQCGYFLVKRIGGRFFTILCERLVWKFPKLRTQNIGQQKLIYGYFHVLSY